MTAMLDGVIHARLIKDMTSVCDRAAVSPSSLQSSAALVCAESDLDWLIHFRESGMPGLKMTGKGSLVRCMAITAALLRNFIDARIRTVDQVIDDPVDCSVLVCPNLYTLGVKNMPPWRVQKLYDTLVVRYTQDLPTVVWVESLDGVKDYGPSMADLLDMYKTSKG